MSEFFMGVVAAIGGVCTFIVVVAVIQWIKDEQSKNK